MSSLSVRLSLFVETYMDNFKTFLSCSTKAEKFLIRATFSWAISSTEAITLWRPSNCFSVSNLNTPATLLFSEETTSQDRFRLCMDSTMRSYVNTATQIPGNIALKSLTILELEPLLREKSSASMEVSLLTLKPLIKSDLLREEWKSHTKVLSVILCGPIPKTLKHGQWVQEEQDGYLVQK